MKIRSLVPLGLVYWVVGLLVVGLAAGPLIRAVATLPSGRIVLPGLDPDTPQAVFETISTPAAAEDHPQARIAALIRDMGLALAEVGKLPSTPPAAARNRRRSSLRPSRAART